MNTAPNVDALLDIDLTDPDLNWVGIPHEPYRALRETAPVRWVEQTQTARAGMIGKPGYWAVTRHRDIAYVSKNSKVFSSRENGAIIRHPEGTGREWVEQSRVVMMNQDDPEHTALRRIVTRGFTPQAIKFLTDILRERSEKIVRNAVAEGSGDFVADVANALPVNAIADLLGVPDQDRDRLFAWSNAFAGGEDPEFAGSAQQALMDMLGYAGTLAIARKADPRDDIVTTLLNADKDGRGLTEDEFAFFVVALFLAGNDTTRNTITHSMHAFINNPDQWELWKRERPATMVEEALRWGTPITSFQRTALQDTEIGGVRIAKGDRVGLFYASANHDETVFDNPFSFDITRDPNPHFAFGAPGVHYCLGVALARLEIRLIFDQLADLVPGISALAEPIRLRSSYVNGVKEFQVSYNG